MAIRTHTHTHRHEHHASICPEREERISRTPATQTKIPWLWHPNRARALRPHSDRTRDGASRGRYRSNAVAIPETVTQHTHTHPCSSQCIQVRPATRPPPCMAPASLSESAGPHQAQRSSGAAATVVLYGAVPRVVLVVLPLSDHVVLAMPMSRKTSHIGKQHLSRHKPKATE